MMIKMIRIKSSATSESEKSESLSSDLTSDLKSVNKVIDQFF